MGLAAGKDVELAINTPLWNIMADDTLQIYEEVIAEAFIAFQGQGIQL